MVREAGLGYGAGMGDPAVHPGGGAYDAYAEKLSWQRSEPMHEWMYARLLRNFETTAGLDTSGSLLEVGCGTGRIAKAARHWGRYEAVEPTDSLAALVRARYGATVHHAALPDLPDIGPYDAALAVHVLEHAPDPWKARAWLAAIRDTLRPGGALLIASPDARTWRTAFWESDWSHAWPTTPMRVAELMVEVGLDVQVATTTRAGSVTVPGRLSAAIASGLWPRKPVDAVTTAVMGRPLGTGLKIGLLWPLTFVIGRR
jgi:SAM-dependent methyltransferase